MRSPPFSRRAVSLLLAALVADAPAAAPLPALQVVPADAPAPVRYEISFPDRVHHEADVRIHYRDLQPGTLELRMSRTSPGRYALHEFAKNVYALTATDGEGRPLPVDRPDPHQWNVSGHGGEAVIRYTLFADRADGTYSGVDESHAHLNVPATFMWARGMFERPVELTVRLPPGSGWRVATQLVPTEDPEVWTAPTHHYFLDSPVEASDHVLREWTLDGQTIRVALHHLGTPEELERYADHAQSIAREQRNVFGELPEFDYGSYVFLACYLPWVAGDGMEHRNSTILTSTGSLEGNMTGLLGTLSHEFFHAWNMERIRAAALEPFDLEEAVMSGELWFGEGFTSYYDDLTMMRGGVIGVEEYARRLGGSIDAVANSPGRRFFSPVEMSRRAPFVDAAVSIDPTNGANTFISYYTWGSMIALALDLRLRSDHVLTLDRYMRAVWESHGETERPYTMADLEAILASTTGDPTFAASFFERFVRGGAVPDFEPLLARAGFDLRLARRGEPILARTRLVPAEGGLLVPGATLIGSPLYEAGVDRGDVLLTLEGRDLTAPEIIEQLLRDRHPGDQVELTYRSRGGVRTATVSLMEDPTLEVAPLDDPTPAQLAFRRAWLAGTGG